VGEDRSPGITFTLRVLYDSIRRLHSGSTTLSRRCITPTSTLRSSPALETMAIVLHLFGDESGRRTRKQRVSLSRVSWDRPRVEARGGRLARADRRQGVPRHGMRDAVRERSRSGKHKENLRLYRDLTEDPRERYNRRHQHGARPRQRTGVLPDAPSRRCYYKCVSDVLAASPI